MIHTKSGGQTGDTERDKQRGKTTDRTEASG